MGVYLVPPISEHKGMNGMGYQPWNKWIFFKGINESWGKRMLSSVDNILCPEHDEPLTLQTDISE